MLPRGLREPLGRPSLYPALRRCVLADCPLGKLSRERQACIETQRLSKRLETRASLPGAWHMLAWPSNSSSGLCG